MILNYEPVKGDPELIKLGIHRDTHPFDFTRVQDDLKECIRIGDDGTFYKIIRTLCQKDLFFLLYFILEFPVNDPFCIARCYEVQADCNYTLDLWSREHFKSTIITCGRSIFDVIQNRENRIGIFSQTGALAKRHLNRIKLILESCVELKTAFPDIFFANPASQSRVWSTDFGLLCKRRGNFVEMTFQAHGLIDSMPTGMHFTKMAYDDIVSPQETNSPEMMKKLEDRYRLSINLGAKGGDRRVIGTRYNLGDVYGMIMKQKKWKSRIFPSEVDENGKQKRDGKPVMLTPEELEEKKTEMGEFIYCLDGETKILMSDYSVKSIKDIVSGDGVIGLKRGSIKSKLQLIETPVKNAWIKRSIKTIKIILENGDEIICTPEHKWWTGRWKGKGEEERRKEYSPVGLGYGELGRLSQILDFKRINRNNYTEDQIRAWDYLAGFFDGEGTVSGGSLSISQSHVVHPEICKKLEGVLEKIGISHSIYTKTEEQNQKYSRNGKASRTYLLRGGRQFAFEFLNITDVAKRSQIVKRLFEYKSRVNSKGGASRIKVVDIVDCDSRDVYAIETGTGNYIANGYVSSNSSQMLQHPVAASSQRFKTSDIITNPNLPDGMNYFLIVDPANKKRKKSDYTVMWVIGTASDRTYRIVDVVRDKLSLGERTEKLFDICREYGIQEVGYEEYGMQSDIDHIEEKMVELNYYFNIIPLGGIVSKEDRIKKLMPIFEKKRFIFPENIFYTDYTGEKKDLVYDFIYEEFLTFPFGTHDDLLDSLARIVDPKMHVYFPEYKKEDIPQKKKWDPLASPSSRANTGWMAR